MKKKIIEKKKRKILPHVKLIHFIIILILCTAGNVQTTYAAQNNNYLIKQDDVDIIFVIDYSNSMNGNDKDKTAIQMIEAVLDIANPDDMRIGIVAHNDRILDYSAPVSLNEKETREALKKTLNSLTRSGSTDTGLALKMAGEMLSASIEDGRKGHIIVLSDGEPDLRYSKTGRTIEECYRDMDETAAYCAEKGIPIDTIAFGKDFGGETSLLKKLSDNTNGSIYISDNPDVIISIFGEIINRYTYSIMQPVSVSLSDGSIQNIELDVRNMFPDEINILAVSPKKIQDATVMCSGAEISYSQSGCYFTSKIKNLNNEKINVQIKGTEGQEIKIYLLLYQNKEFQIIIPDKVNKNVPYEIQYYFTGKDGAVSEDTFYQQFKYEIIPNNKADESMAGLLETEFNKAELSEGFMKLTSKAGMSGQYSFKVKVSNGYYSMEISDITLNVVNLPPDGLFETRFDYVRLSKESEFDLNTYFNDGNGDVLAYEIVNITGDASDNIILEGSSLKFNPKKSGTTQFQIRISDEEGAEYVSSVIEVEVEPIWRHYLGIIIGITVVLFMLILYFLWLLIKKQKVRHIEYEKAVEQIKEIEMNSSFSGKMNIYFTKMPNDTEAEPLTFALYQIKEKILTLSQLLEMVEIPVEDLDSENICFRAGQNNELILQHTSKNSIMVGTSMICKKLKYSLDYGNKIYITSQDGEYELELHYVSMRS